MDRKFKEVEVHDMPTMMYCIHTYHSDLVRLVVVAGRMRSIHSKQVVSLVFININK